LARPSSAGQRTFLAFAAAYTLSVTTHEYPLHDAGRALADLKVGQFEGAAVAVP
jgi:propanol-preferring alcohol dehydrogenase